MKLLWFTIAPLDCPGFRATQFGMASSLERLGWRVHLVSKSYGGGRSCAVYPGFSGEVTLLGRAGKLGTELRYHKLLWDELRKERYDVVLFEPPHTRLMALPALIGRRDGRRPSFVMDFRTPLVEEGLESRLEKLNYQMAQRFARRYLPAVSVITDELLRDLPAIASARKPVVVWGSGVDSQLFDPERSTAAQLPGIGGRRIVIYHGSLGLKRGLEGLVAAMEPVGRVHQDAVLVIIGEGPAAGPLAKQVVDLHLENRVRVLPAEGNERIPALIKAATFGVIPLPPDRCWQVSSPIKLFEYMAMKKPLILSDIVAHREIVGDHPAVVYARSSRIEDLAQALLEAFSREPELALAARSLRELVLERHTWDVRAKHLSDFFQALVEATEPRCGVR